MLDTISTMENACRLPLKVFPMSAVPPGTGTSRYVFSALLVLSSMLTKSVCQLVITATPGTIQEPALLAILDMFSMERVAASWATLSARHLIQMELAQAATLATF